MELFSDQKVPTRSAPRPPGVPNSQKNNPWSIGNDLSGIQQLSTTQKKKPPPRPPPPKFTIKNLPVQEKFKKPTRPTQLLTNFFAKKDSKHSVINNAKSVFATSHQNSNTATFPQTSSKDTDVKLIDLSPPGSPTSTTRSSSDGISVNSLGSDGSTFPFTGSSSSNTLQSDSAFDDDFDFFGLNLNSKKSTINDPWKVTPTEGNFNPFDSITSSNLNNSVNEIKVNDSSFFAFNAKSSNEPQVPSKPVFTMPTIIRTKGQKDIKGKSNYSSIKSSTDVQYSTQNNSTNQKSNCDNKPATEVNWGDDLSPPMPQQPPPPPPPEYIASIEDGLVENYERPYGIAWYDYPASHPDDLALKEGDKVFLIRAINEEWVEGRVGNCTGIFPKNFIDIKVPLPCLPKNIVTAIYPFKGEFAEDLSFEEGARIKVLSRISDSWLYGEYNGKKGQFPANYIDQIPSDVDH